MPMSQPVALTVAPVMVCPLVATMVAFKPVEPAATQTAAEAGVAPTMAATVNAPAARVAAQIARPAMPAAVRGRRGIIMGSLLRAVSVDAQHRRRCHSDLGLRICPPPAGHLTLLGGRLQPPIRRPVRPGLRRVPADLGLLGLGRCRHGPG